ncbi:MAG: potassium channel family protein [Gemmatimonadetes bacterium]|nr:potassium channel family protein [Gemmatimonadota bacterium]
MKELVAATAAFAMFLFSGGLWIGIARLVPEGTPRSVLLVGVGALFAGVFMWLLISRVRLILAGEGNMLRHGAVAVLELALMLGAFAAVYQILGIQDNTRPGRPLSHAYFDSLYYSVVTFTTLGYGDFYPRGVGRVLAGMEALTGYVILGMIASTAASVISPYSRAGKGEPPEEGEVVE